MVVRIIGTKSCPNCNRLQQEYREAMLNFEFYDADLDEHQEQLDAWKITTMPVIQFVKDGVIVEQMPAGPYRASLVKHKLDELQKKVEKNGTKPRTA